MPAIDRLDADLLGEVLERRVLKKVAYGVRNRAVAVLQFLFGTLASLRRRGVRDLPISAEALVFVGDVVGRDADVEAQVQRGVDFRYDFFALQLTDGLLQEPDVGIEPNRVDVAVLFASQEIACA